MALKKLGTSYTALRAATRLPPVERAPERPPERPAEAAVGGASAGQLPEPVEAAPAPQARRTRRPAAPAGEGRAPAPHFRLRVPYPARGTCAEFDEIAAVYGAEVAMRTLFKRAFDAWVAGFHPGRVGTMETDYARGPAVFATSRIIAPAVIDGVTEAIDPLGVRTRTYIAERIAMAAMKAYMAR